MATRNQSLAALTQANTLLTQQMAALQQQIQQLLQAQQQAQQQHPVQPAVVNPNNNVDPAITAAHQRAQANNGIAGYENERALTVEELAYIDQMMGFGISKAAAHELFMHGYNENKKWKEITKESIGHLVTNVTKNKSQYCLKPESVFYGHSFGAKIAILENWIKHQESIGSPATSVVWNQTPNIEEVNEQRMNYLAEKKTNTNNDGILVPGPLTRMQSIASFEESLMAYLSIKRGQTGVPLAYVLRREPSVTDEQRAGAVGPGQTYEHWDEYLVACTVHTGDHWTADNTAVYNLISHLIRNGPGWHYIEQSTHRRQDGRALWNRLLEQAYDVSNVDQICHKARRFYSEQRYSGDTRHTTFDKYCRDWYTNNKTLAYHDRLPPQRDIVADFINSLDVNTIPFQTAALAVRQCPIARENFDKAIQIFKRNIGDNHPPNGKRKINELNGAAPGGRPNPGSRRNTSNTKDYSKSTKDFIQKGEWYSMSTQQRDDFKKARAKRQQGQSNQSNGRESRLDKKIRKALSAISQEKEQEDKDKKENAGDQFGAQAHGGGSSNRRNGK